MQFFGTLAQHVTLSQLSEVDKKILKDELRDEFKNDLFPTLRDELFSKMQANLVSMGVSIQPPTPPSPPKVSPIIISTKRSCPTIEETGDGGVDIHVECELYINDPPQYWVALGKFYSNYIFWFRLCLFSYIYVVLGKIFKLGSTIHHQTIKDDMIRVVVINVRDSSTRVHMSIEDVQIVGQAPRSLIIWPTRLAKPIVVRLVFILFNIFTRVIFIY